MHTLLVISLGIFEIAILQIAAIILGFSIHFFFVSRKSMNSVRQSLPNRSGISEADEWRLKCYEQIDIQKKREEESRRELDEAQEYQDLLNKKLEHTREELIALRETPVKPAAPEAEYLAKLVIAQDNLSDHSQQITRLLEQVDLLKEYEQKHFDTKQTNETLVMQLRDFRQALSNKESEIKQIRQQQVLIRELKERLEKAHEEYNELEDKLQKLDTHISKPQNRNFEYEELQQSCFKLTKECDEIKIKQLAMLVENQRLSRLLAETEDKLHESNFQRQQYLRKITFLEELNHDLQELTGHHKKLQSQMRRIGEIEVMLSKSSKNN